MWQIETESSNNVSPLNINTFIYFDVICGAFRDVLMYFFTYCEQHRLFDDSFSLRSCRQLRLGERHPEHTEREREGGRWCHRSGIVRTSPPCERRKDQDQVSPPLHLLPHSLLTEVWTRTKEEEEEKKRKRRRRRFPCSAQRNWFHKMTLH